MTDFAKMSENRRRKVETKIATFNLWPRHFLLIEKSKKASLVPILYLNWCLFGDFDISFREIFLIGTNKSTNGLERIWPTFGIIFKANQLKKWPKRQLGYFFAIFSGQGLKVNFIYQNHLRFLIQILLEIKFMMLSKVSGYNLNSSDGVPSILQ